MSKRIRRATTTALPLAAAALGIALSGPSSTAQLRDPVEEPETGIECHYVHARSEESLGRRFGGFYENQWTNGIVPYEFVETSTAAVRRDTLTDLVFDIPGSGAQLVSASGFPWFFQIGDVLRVQGSNLNDGRDLIITDRYSTGGNPNVVNVLEVDLRPLSTFSYEDATGTSIIVFSTEAVSELNQQRFVSAAQVWESVVNVSFVPRTTQTTYLRVKNFDRNRVSGAGMGNGVNTLFMDAWSSERTLLHELAHELGAKHEQERPDRNQYVTIDTSLVTDGFEGNFTIDQSMSIYPPTIYDFASIMHYSRTAFLDPDSTGNTIVVNQPWTAEWQNVIGTIDTLSFWDRKTMSFLYAENDWRFADRNGGSASNPGTFLDPYATFGDAYADAPTGGRVIVPLPGTYDEPGVYDKAMTVEAPLGGVLLRGN